jgi:hypothetical protein
LWGGLWRGRGWVYFVCVWHEVEVFGRVGEQGAGFADFLVVGGLVWDEVFAGMLGCFEEFGGYAASDHLDVLL